MVRSEDMKKISLFGHNSDKEKIILKLHKLGVMQLHDLKSSDIDLPNSVPADELREISDLLMRISRINSVLTIPGRDQTFKQKMFGLETAKKATVVRKRKSELEKDATDFLKHYEDDLINLEEEFTKKNEELVQIKEIKKVVLLFQEHNIPVGVLGDMKYVSFVSGIIQNTNIEAIKKELKKELNGYSYVSVSQESKKDSLIVIATLKYLASNLNFIVKKYGVSTFGLTEVPSSKKPLEWVEKKETQIIKDIEKIKESVLKYQKEIYDTTIFLREDLEILKERFDAVNKMKESDNFFVIQGWVPVSKLKTLYNNMGEAVISEADPKEKDNVPVRLRNPWFLKPFELLTELYATPKYKDIDPTFIVGPLFLIYAGFMLTDFIYGLGLLVLGAVIFSIFRKAAGGDGTKKLSISIMGIGIISMFFGVLTGSYLGDMPQYLLGISTAQLAIWKDPLADPLYFLIISLFVGLFHLNFGLVLGTIEDVRNKQWKTLLSERVIWWMLQLSILAFVLGSSLLGKILIGITIVMVLVLQGPLGLLGMTGFMGDVISYSRLFALALSTAGIAMTINLLADMVSGVPYVGIVFTIIIFIIGHLFSFAMNALGSFVHSIRLQFVEFFGKFYEGGGDRFEPFKEERVYTEVKQ